MKSIEMFIFYSQDGVEFVLEDSINKLLLKVLKKPLKNLIKYFTQKQGEMIGERLKQVKKILLNDLVNIN